jgi:uncharacterized protein YqeY
MRAKDAMRLGALRMAKAALMNQEVQKGRPLDEGESQQVMTSLIKQRRDSIEQFRKGGRDDLRTRKRRDHDRAYLPAPMDAAGLGGWSRRSSPKLCKRPGPRPVMKALMPGWGRRWTAGP